MYIVLQVNMTYDSFVYPKYKDIQFTFIKNIHIQEATVN